MRRLPCSALKVGRDERQSEHNADGRILARHVRRDDVSARICLGLAPVVMNAACILDRMHTRFGRCHGSVAHAQVSAWPFKTEMFMPSIASSHSTSTVAPTEEP